MGENSETYCSLFKKTLVLCSNIAAESLIYFILILVIKKKLIKYFSGAFDSYYKLYIPFFLG